MYTFVKHYPYLNQYVIILTKNLDKRTTLYILVSRGIAICKDLNIFYRNESRKNG